jgi:hypothetical protein
VWPFRRKNLEESLRGAPEVRRLKTYSAESGYVYQYFYEGYRGVLGGNAYVFSVSADRKNWSPVSIVVVHNAYSVWEKQQGRSLAQNEVYAIAKMGLFGVLDAHPPAEVIGREFKISEERALEILALLEM